MSGGARTWRRRCIPLALLVAGPAAAQVAAPAAQPYVDRVLDSGPQLDAPADDTQTYDAAGWSRSLRLEYSLGKTRGVTDASTRAVALTGHIDTPQHGTLSVLGNLVHFSSEASPLGLSQGARARSWSGRVDQRAMPLHGGWLANHSAGDINTGVPGLGRGLTRVFLPSTPMAGVAGDWSLADEMSFNAAAGRPGLYSGFDITGFQPTRGQVVSAGGQMRLAGDRSAASRLHGALQWIHARDAADAGIPTGSNSQAAWGALAWEGAAPWAAPAAPANVFDPLSLRPGRARALWSVLRSSGPGGLGSGGTWLDAAWRTQAVQHTAGLFHFDPDLRWGVTGMPGDLRGAYWRGDQATRQWQVAWTLETSDSVTGRYGSSSFGSLHGRYQLSLRNSVDGTLAVRRGTGSAESVQVNFSRASGWGQTRWRAGLLRTGFGRTRSLGVDHTWELSAPNVFSTSLGWQGSDEPGVASPLWTWGLLASTSPLSRLTIDASLHGAHGAGTEALFANVGVSWQLSRDWAVGLRYTEARGEDPQGVQVVSALTSATQVAPLQPVTNRSLQVTLRYETRAGTMPIPLGGTRTSGAGSLSGSVFLDADRSGKREASEQGVANVTVVLDGKYAVRTDSAGRYSFPSVVAGVHTLQVQADNVPLPWSPANPDPVKVEVLVRGSTVEDFPMQRER